MPVPAIRLFAAPRSVVWRARPVARLFPARGTPTVAHTHSEPCRLGRAFLRWQLARRQSVVVDYSGFQGVVAVVLSVVVIVVVVIVAGVARVHGMAMARSSRAGDDRCRIQITPSARSAACVASSSPSSCP